jgi:hypothetical protein
MIYMKFSVIKEREKMSESTEIFCPKCKLKNDISASVCVHCQAPLPTDENNRRTTKRMSGEETLFDIEELHPNAKIPENGFVIISMESGQEIATVTKDRFILGRTVEEARESIIDLSDFGAYGQGVSRFHVLVRKTATGYEISDMSSTNGTWLNEQEIAPDRFYPIKSGDVIRMGKMRVSVLFLPRKTGNG